MDKKRIISGIAKRTGLVLLFGWLFFLLYLSYRNINHFGVDNYFMFAHAKTILEQGFIKTDIFSLHEGFNFMIPQWLYAVTVYLLKTEIGNTAVMWFAIGMFALLVFMWWKDALIISEGNKEISFVFTVLVAAYTGSCFLKPRPFVVSSMLALADILVMENYRKKKDQKLFILIGLISVLCVNFHNSIWIFLFLVHLCYIGEWVINLILKRENEYKITDLLLINCISLLCGLINPYGIHALTYIFTSMDAISTFKYYITELLYSLPSNSIISYSLLIPSLIAVLINIKKIKVRYLLLYFGTALMMISARRNAIQFMTAGSLILPYIFREVKLKDLNQTLYKVFKLFSLTAGFIWLLFIAVTVRIPEHDDGKAEMFTATDWLYENAPQGSTVYDMLDPGSYLIYKGFKPYIDGRLEVYGYANNGKEDIGEEFINLVNNQYKNFGELVDKYQFDYIYHIDNKSNEGLKTWLQNNPDKYEEIYRYEDGAIYKKTEPEESENIKTEGTDRAATLKRVDFNKVPCHINGKEESMASLIEDELMVMYIGRDSCETCRNEAPDVLEAASEYAEIVKVEILNDDAEPYAGKNLVRRAYIKSMDIKEVPAFIIFDNGRPVDLMVGGREVIPDIEKTLKALQ